MDDLSLAAKLGILAIIIGIVILMAYYPKIMARIRGSKEGKN